MADGMLRISLQARRFLSKRTASSGEVTTRAGQAKVTTEGNVTVVENEPATVESFGETATKAAVLKKPRKAKPAATESAAAETAATGEKRMSCIEAALKVLSESAEPMNTQQMIAAMEAKGYWSSPGGKNSPCDPLQRDPSRLGQRRFEPFVKAERGRFTVSTNKPKATQS